MLLIACISTAAASITGAGFHDFIDTTHTCVQSVQKRPRFGRKSSKCAADLDGLDHLDRSQFPDPLTADVEQEYATIPAVRRWIPHARSESVLLEWPPSGGGWHETRTTARCRAQMQMQKAVYQARHNMEHWKSS